MSDPCGTCGGTGHFLAHCTCSDVLADMPTCFKDLTDCTGSEHPCPTCRRIVSVEDVELLDELRKAWTEIRENVPGYSGSPLTPDGLRHAVRTVSAWYENEKFLRARDSALAIQQAVEEEREANCAAICNLCGFQEFPLAEDAPEWHRCAIKGSEDYPRQKCKAAAIRARGNQ